tara:strand:+ start:501 stop:800 length:300 start_codon:yes stop_codon:yes gene_type:complete
VHWFFPAQSASTAKSILVVEALIAVGEESPQVRLQMKEYVEDTVEAISGLLPEGCRSPAAAPCRAVIQGIVCLCFNKDSLMPIQLSPRYLRASPGEATS